MKKIIVTGATSMIGVALIEECIKDNVEVTALARSHSSRLGRLPASRLVTVAECSLDGIADFGLSDDGFDCMYHFAWCHTSKDTRDDPELQWKNVQYTLDAVRLAKRIGCRKFIGAGSQAEYGICRDTITAQTKAQPLSSYGICKYAAGRLAEKLCGRLGMACIWGRIFSVYGENDNDGTMVRYAFEKYGSGETAYFSAGTQMWNYLHSSDAGRMFYLMGEKCSQSKVYNVAHHESRLLREYIAEIKGVLGDGFQYELAEDDGREKVWLDADTSDTNIDLDYYLAVSFEEGIRMLKKKFYGGTLGGSGG